MGEMHDLLSRRAPRLPCCKPWAYYPGEWTPFSPWGAPALENPERKILTCFVAPLAVQRAARAQGINAIMMIRVPGLVEALERSGLKR